MKKIKMYRYICISKLHPFIAKFCSYVLQIFQNKTLFLCVLIFTGEHIYFFLFLLFLSVYIIFVLFFPLFLFFYISLPLFFSLSLFLQDMHSLLVERCTHFFLLRQLVHISLVGEILTRAPLGGLTFQKNFQKSNQFLGLQSRAQTLL